MNQSRAMSICAVLVTAGQTFGAITFVSGGPVMNLTNPTQMKYTGDAYNFNKVFYWTERTSFNLASDLVVSILPPTTFITDSTTHYDDNTHFIPSGTTVDSYYAYWDPQSGGTITRFQFDDPIVGIITNPRDSAPADDHFMLSDYLIDPLVPSGNIPATHFDARGSEPLSGDFIRWLSPTVIELWFGAGDPGDQIRILTSPVPEPTCLLTLALGFAAMVPNRRARRMR
jgi:hypothetical protein